GSRGQTASVGGAGQSRGDGGRGPRLARREAAAIDRPNPGLLRRVPEEMTAETQTPISSGGREIRVRGQQLLAPDPCSPTALSWLSWFAVVILGGYLLFAHGCHGDEDNELLAAAAQGRGTSIGTGLAKKLVS